MKGYFLVLIVIVAVTAQKLPTRLKKGRRPPGKRVPAVGSPPVFPPGDKPVRPPTKTKAGPPPPRHGGPPMAHPSVLTRPGKPPGPAKRKVPPPPGSPVPPPTGTGYPAKGFVKHPKKTKQGHRPPGVPVPPPTGTGYPGFVKHPKKTKQGHRPPPPGVPVRPPTGTGYPGFVKPPKKTTHGAVPPPPHGGAATRAPCQFFPVCGSDGFTYMSECFLWSGVTKMCDGFCPCPVAPAPPAPVRPPFRPPVRPPVHPPRPGHNCICPDVWAPVCGVNGDTFGNDCERRCRGVSKACAGECPCPPPVPCENKCPYLWRPVCSVRGKTHANECLLRCSKEPYACEGECPCEPEGGQPPVPPNTCGCAPWDIDPVCTTDGKTIWHGCQAICQGEDIACSSECPC